VPEIPAYEREPYRTSLDVEVVAGGEEEGRPYAVLDDTVLYPEGGGQPADHGWLGAVGVLDVQRVGGEIRHRLAAPLGPGPAALRLDWERRFDHMQQHTAQHLLSALAADRWGWATTSFHLGAETSDVELEVAALAGAEIAALEEAIAAEVRAARPVIARRVAPADYESLGARSRGLPADHVGDVRLVEIAGIDRSTCGGTHVRSTAELEAVKLLGSEPMRGGTRLHFVAGGRLRRRLQAHEARAALLRRLLETSDAELPAVAAARLADLRDAERALRHRDERLAAAWAETLATRPGPVVELHLDGFDGAFLQRLANAFAPAAAARVALLTAAGPKGSFFALAAGPEAQIDLKAAGAAIAALLEGRGGGSGCLYHGKAGNLERRDEALAALEQRLHRRQ